MTATEIYVLSFAVYSILPFYTSYVLLSQVKCLGQFLRKSESNSASYLYDICW